MKSYDLSNLILMPQDRRYSTCLTRWIKEDGKKIVISLVDFQFYMHGSN
jgi:hypothetical protein